MNCFSRGLLTGTAALGLASAAPAQERSLDQIAGTFGARPTVLDISLSPSGNKIAYISPGVGSSETVFVVDLTGDAKPVPVVSQNEEHVSFNRCNWATEARIVCELSVIRQSGPTLLGFTRSVSVAADGSGSFVLTARDSSEALGYQQDGGTVIALDDPAGEDRVLMTRDFVKEYSSGTRLANDKEGLAVESVSVEDGSRRTVETPDRMASAYIADETGKVRMKVRRMRDNTGTYTGENEISYQPRGSGQWSGLGVDLGQFVPIAVDSGKDVAYGFSNVGGYDVISTIALDGSRTMRPVVAPGNVDVDQLIRIGRQQRVVGASFATEKREIVYFDEGLKKLAGQLRQALPGQPLINIIDSSEDESKLLIVASSDTDPGTTYLLDRTTNAMSELLAVRAGLAVDEMAPMKPVSFTATDGTTIPGYLTLPLGAQGPTRAIVMPHGGPGARDEWGFDWLVQFFAARGYAVLQPNFRGSAGYGDAWFGRNGFKEWRTAVGDVNDAGRWLVQQGIANADGLAVFGWSYGGYAALQSQVLNPELFKAVVAVAPVTDLATMKGDARRYTNFTLVSNFIGSGPHVAEGSPAQHADRFRAPVLLFHGTNDLNVDVGHARLMEGKLRSQGKSVKYIEYDNIAHSLANGSMRANMLYETDKFLDGVLAD